MIMSKLYSSLKFLRYGDHLEALRRHEVLATMPASCERRYGT
jgi:hypothetical protein